MSPDKDSPRTRLHRERKKIKGESDGEYEPYDLPSDLARRLLDLSHALDEDNPRETYYAANGEKKSYAAGTVYQYLHMLIRWRELDGIDYLDTTAHEINELAADMDTGMHSESPDGGYSRQTVNKFFCAVKAFYRYHDDPGVDPEEIDMFKKANSPAYDDRDMFTRQEINELRDVMDNPRHRALLEMLIYTGQRIRAILTLRVKDFDLEGGYFYLNEDAAGLKGATKRGRKRPLFGARKYVQEWLEYHPRGDEPEAWVFVGDPKNPRVDLDNPLTERSVRRILQNAADEAGLDKSANPHKFRHYFVTVMKRDYNMEDDTVKFLLGHGEQSNVMNTTYKHIKNEDYIRAAEEVLGQKEPEERNSFTPPYCFVCGETLQPKWKSCPSCGEVYAPDAEKSKGDIEEAMFESAVAAESEEEQAALGTVRKWFRENPDKAAEFIITALERDEFPDQPERERSAR